jgi:hypothetical protein
VRGRKLTAVRALSISKQRRWSVPTSRRPVERRRPPLGGLRDKLERLRLFRYDRELSDHAVRGMERDVALVVVRPGGRETVQVSEVPGAICAPALLPRIAKVHTYLSEDPWLNTILQVENVQRWSMRSVPTTGTTFDRGVQSVAWPRASWLASRPGAAS